MPLTINTGHWLSKPLESRDSIIKRLFQCNPGLTRYGWQKLINNKPCSMQTLFDKQLNIYYQTIQNQSFCPTIEARLLGHLLHLHKRNCEECAKAGYHTEIYHFPWLKNCPLHNKPLLDRCPECHRAWFLPEQVSSNCKTCGLSSFSNYLSQQRLLDQEDFTPLIELSNCLEQLTKPTDIWFSWDRYMERAFSIGDKINMAPSDKDFASVLLYLYPDTLNKIHGYVSCQPIIHKRWQVESILSTDTVMGINDHNMSASNQESYSELEGIIIKLPRQLIKARWKALKRIYQALDAIHPNTHPLHRSEVSVATSLEGDCPLCIAFSCWYSIIVADNRNWFIPRFHPEQDFLFFRGMKHYPKTPLPLKYLVTDEDFFATPLKFQAFMYEIDLLQSFLQVFDYIAITYDQIIKSGRKAVLIMDLKRYVSQLKSNQDGEAFFQLHNNRLDGYFPKSYLPEEFALKTYPTIMKMLQKNRPHHFYKNKKIYRHGLNKEQFQMLDLLFVHNDFGKHYITYSDFLERNYDQIKAFLDKTNE